MRILVYTCLLLATSAWATEQIGQTYSIAEGDMLKDVEKAVEQTDWQKVLTKDQDSWGAFSGVSLPAAKEDNVRRFIPWYTTEFEIRDPRNGSVLYPKGFTFNPLQYVTMPWRVVVVSPDQDDWLLANVRPTDEVIYTNGNVLKKTSDLALNRRVYVLNPPVVERFKLRSVPSIVEQHDKSMQVTEVDIEKWRKEQSK
ncbi:TPA: hypothetical protein AB5C39_001806 [Vibrio mimicus]|nr:hypothetical protein [Vibrio cholerae]EJL6310956.1 hypothetical protein [Vibrio cholerae]EKF9265793.1 hypothetical protein [Vibrio cholerae]EKF9842526.1 hypothetical protein [Vibrio cholerae]HCJ7273254.1 hypothetical protein [Vibrio cholerae]